MVLWAYYDLISGCGVQGVGYFRFLSAHCDSTMTNSSCTHRLYRRIHGLRLPIFLTIKGVRGATCGRYAAVAKAAWIDISNILPSNTAAFSITTSSTNSDEKWPVVSVLRVCLFVYALWIFSRLSSVILPQ